MYKDSHYGLLRLPLDATTDQVTAKAWQLEQMLVELACSGDAQAVLRLREIREARRVLCDPVKRATYDRAYVAALTAHLRYVPPRPGELPRQASVVGSEPDVVAVPARQAATREGALHETWMVFGPGAQAT
jgi:curved DNA-binding protein CbpA